MKMEQIEKLELNKIYHGDCIEVLKTFPDNSVDAVVCDPPYGLEFMGKEWDKFKEGKNIAGGTVKDKSIIFGRMCGKAPSFYQMSKKRFGVKGQEGENDLKVKKNFEVLPRFFNSDLQTFQEFSYNWGKEVLRVLKPGGFLLSFGGTRTYHRMVCGLEDAGFDIRDCIMWVYGSGFPKSLNIGKQIDKHNGMLGYDITKSKTKEGSEWEGWGTSLKPAVEPIVVARKPLSEKSVALNVLKWGTGGINIDGCRITLVEGEDISVDRETKKLDTQNQGWGFKAVSRGNEGRFPSNLILDEESSKMLDEQTGDVGCSSDREKYKGKKYGNSVFLGDKPVFNSPTYTDIGGASRFFYCAKAIKSERNAGLDDFEDREIYPQNNSIERKEINAEAYHKTKNNHPTVKPIKLMEYLVKLISRENAIVLDCFMGSGTTAIACLKLNRQFIGIEKEPEYIEIAKARIKPYLEQVKLSRRKK